MSRRPYLGPSEAQANAEALVRRGSPYTAASEMSFRLKWDHHRREPRDLREAVSMVRRAYADEVPSKLHKGTDNAEGLFGAPGFTPQAARYIFDNPDGSDSPDALSYYHSPFRAHLDVMSRGNEAERKRAAVVSHVTIGSQGPQEAAIKEGVPTWCAKVVAEDALRGFLRGLSDMKLNMRAEAICVTV